MSTITFNDAAAYLGGVWDEVERHRRPVVIKLLGLLDDRCTVDFVFRF